MKNGLIQYVRYLFPQERSPWFKRGLSWRLLLGVLLVSSVITLVGTCLQLYLDYQRDLEDVDNRIENVRIAHLGSLTTSLWKLDNKQLVTEMTSVVELKDIVAIRIHLDGEVLQEVGRQLESDENFSSRRFPMVYDDGRNHANLGEMEIIVSLSGVQQRLIDRVLVILGTQSLKTFLVSAFILLFIQSLISRHLVQIAEKAIQIHQGKTDELLSLNRRKNKVPDELDAVVSALNEMIHKSREWQFELEKTVKERTASLRSSEQSLSNAQHMAHIGNWTLDLENNRLVWSDEIFNIFGLQPQGFEVTYEAFLDRVHPDDRVYVDSEFKDSLEEGRPYDIEHRILRDSDNVLRWVHEKCAHFRNEAGEVIRSEGTVQDITERKRPESYLIASEYRLQQLLDLSREAPNLSEKQLLERSLDIAVHVTDSKIGYLHLVNEDQETLSLSTWNDAALELCTAAYENHYPLSDAGIWADAIRERRSVVHNDYPLIADKPGYPEGHFPVIRHMSTPVLDSDKISLIVGVGNKETDYDDYDVTMLQQAANDIEKIVMRRRDEAALQLAKTEAEKANKAKSEFLANMSHDLRTPLNAMMGLSEMMSLKVFGPLGDPHYDDYAQDIHKSGSHLISLIDDILDLSKVEAGKYVLNEKDLDITPIIDACVNMISTFSDLKKIDLTVDTPPDLPLVKVDERAMTQVLNNLLSNAVKFTPDGGHITVSAYVMDENSFEISVADTGTGMSREDITKALKPFEQPDSTHARRHEGTGLGLHLSQNLVKLHGGRLKIESERGQGTTVVVHLPPHRTVLS